MTATWNRNLEHEGLQFQSDCKPSQEIINKLKANGFKWSGRQKLWYAKEQPYRVELLNSIATYEGEIGERLTFAEKIDRKTTKAEDRAEYFGEKAEKAHEEASNLLEIAHKMADVIPLGQPILVGHHSEKRDRNYRARIDNKYRKAFETEDKAKYCEHRASAALETIDRTFDVGVILRRIKKLEVQQRSNLLESDKHIARWEAALFRFKAGIDSERYDILSRKFLESNERRYELPQEQIDYWKAKVEESGVKVWSKSDFTKGEIIKTRFGPAQVLKTNPKTVKVEFLRYPKDSWEQRADFSKVPYDELKPDCKTGKTIDQVLEYAKGKMEA
ncbi:MAG: hypothetical protein A4E49_00305 [Methanosaeta sp. PtaU1.Bin112]|nr:MAG: hypothetical protein A4E49_00305 [Methanosaeta sp. PtaU1.Bin112]